MKFEDLFQQFDTLTVAVVGDVMLDTYWWGRVERISPEAPVPVVAVQKKEFRLGGAGNVALNTRALGATTVLFSVVGNDDAATTLLPLLEEQGIDTRYIIRSNERITTNKIRIMGRNQQMMRLDAEYTHDITTTDEALLLQQFTTFLQQQKPAVVIFEDYNKGVLTENLIHAMISLCKAQGVVTTVDPKRKNFFAFKGIDIFKPNLKEVKEGLNLLADDTTETGLRNIHALLQQQLNHHISLITLSEKGVFYQGNQQAGIIPSHIRNIADVSGAGDTVIAVASLVYAATRNTQLAAEAANIAGGLVCEEVGTATINKSLLLKECTKLLMA